MALLSNQTRRFAAIGALRRPSCSAGVGTGHGAGRSGRLAGGQRCLAWFGNKENGNCMSYSRATASPSGPRVPACAAPHMHRSDPAGQLLEHQHRHRLGRRDLPFCGGCTGSLGCSTGVSASMGVTSPTRVR